MKQLNVAIVWAIALCFSIEFCIGLGLHFQLVPNMTDRVCNKTVGHFLKAFSNIYCASICDDNICTAFARVKSKKMCYLCETFSAETSVHLLGAKFYARDACGDPPSLGERTVIDGNEKYVGSNILYYCETPSGVKYNNEHAICQADGTWSTPNMRCDPPVYVGCFTDVPSRVLLASTEVNNTTAMTLEMCEDHCLNNEYGYFGVEFYDSCFCGNQLPQSEKHEDNKCNTTCKGDERQMCGGHWLISVYKIK